MSNQNAFIAYTNLADLAVQTASSSALLLPVSNIIVPHIARKWRGNDGATDTVFLDYGSSITMDTIAVIGITGTQIRVALSNVDPTANAGEVYDSGQLAVDQKYLQSILPLVSPVSARYMRIDLTTTGSFVEIGRVFTGVRTVFAYNYVAGWQRTWVDPSTRTKTLSNQTLIFKRPPYRTYDISFDFLMQADRDGFIEDIDSVNALQVDVLFVNNPASSNLARDSVWGLMTTLTPVVQPYVGVYTKQYQIEERR
jgi:hypothetical protein